MIISPCASSVVRTHSEHSWQLLSIHRYRYRLSKMRRGLLRHRILQRLHLFWYHPTYFWYDALPSSKPMHVVFKSRHTGTTASIFGVCRLYLSLFIKKLHMLYILKIKLKITIYRLQTNRGSIIRLYDNTLVSFPLLF